MKCEFFGSLTLVLLSLLFFTFLLLWQPVPFVFLCLKESKTKFWQPTHLVDGNFFQADEAIEATGLNGLSLNWQLFGFFCLI